MKINEIEKLDEVPAGMIGQAGKKLGAKVLNKIPGGAAKSKAANMAAQADLGDTANNLHKEFNAHLGSKQLTMAQATGEELVAFLKTKNHKTAARIPSGVLQKKQLDAILMAVAKEATAAQAAAPAANAPVDANKDGIDDNTGKPIKAAPGKAAPAAGAKPKIPADIMAQLQKLSLEQKQQLAELL